MKTFSALYRNGYAETKAERGILEELNKANRDYEHYDPKGTVRGNYLGDFLQKMALNPIAPIQFISNMEVKKKQGLYLIR